MSKKTVETQTDSSQFAGKKVLVTGTVGSVGAALTRRLLNFPGTEVLGFDNNESGLVLAAEELGKRFTPLLGDIRDRDRLIQVFSGIDIVFHSAALKHVPICEIHPLEAIQTNILGVQNIIQAALANGVSHLVYTSSDKAVNPPNVMGTSKLMGEQLIRAANITERNRRTIFTVTRFGNVLGSRGSVLPIFHRQIRRGGPVTITSPKMTRFAMTLDKAVDLVVEAATLAKGGEVFITKMNAICLEDLAAAMIEELAPRYGHDPKAIEMKEIGIRPGEKMSEELMNEEEVRRSIELENHYVALPALTDIYGPSPEDYPGLVNKNVNRAYNSASEPILSKQELREYLLRNGLLEAEKNA
jgi:FlaA1/EpsC-like NDP-sugar epimerase